MRCGRARAGANGKDVPVGSGPRPAGFRAEGAGACPDDLLDVLVVDVGRQSGGRAGGQARVEAARFDVAVELPPRSGAHVGSAGSSAVGRRIDSEDLRQSLGPEISERHRSQQRDQDVLIPRRMR